MENKLEKIRNSENQIQMFEMINNLTNEIIKTNESLICIKKEWVSYGTWSSKCFANKFHFGEKLAKALMYKLSRKITHDEHKEFKIGEFIIEIEDAIYEVL